MPLTSYFNFDLVIEEAGELYRASVIASPVGTASALFDQPLSELELENFILRLGITRQGARQPFETLEMKTVKHCGESLFDAVFNGDVYTCFMLSWEHARQLGQGLRIRLQINVPEFHDYPWEYLYNTRSKQFLSLSNDTPVVRYRVLPYPEIPLSVKPPLKILVMIASPEGFPQLNVEEEWDKLKAALDPLIKQRLVVLERLKKPTLTELQSALRRDEFHIFHFIGHGKFITRKQDGVILLEEETDRRGRPLSGQYLGVTLHDHQSLRLVLLNACEGARTSREDPYAGVAQVLVQQGIPAVIAMQFSIWEKSAITFAQEFYRSIADGFPVDAAVSEARKAIFTDGNEVEWGTPVLFMNAPDGQIFDLEQTGKLPPLEPELATDKPTEPDPGGIKGWFKRTWILLTLSVLLALILTGTWLAGHFFSPKPLVTDTPTLTVSPLVIKTVRPTLTPEPTFTAKPTVTATNTPTPPPVPTGTPTPSATPYSALITDPRGVKMVLVPAGEFIMGYDGSGGPDDERPVHTVTLDSYYIDKFEVSNAQYAACVNLRICQPPISADAYNIDEQYYGNPKYDDYPVIQVTWEMANKFCTQWRKGRLPTEAEWEKAARGPDGLLDYPWGEGITCDLANYRDSRCGRLARPYPVSAFEKGQSYYGAYNMAGNVWEWVADWYSLFYYRDSPNTNPIGPATGLFRVKRGGGFLHTEFFARVTNRESGEMTGYGVDIGFRCVHPVSDTFP